MKFMEVGRTRILPQHITSVGPITSAQRTSDGNIKLANPEIGWLITITLTNGVTISSLFFKVKEAIQAHQNNIIEAAEVCGIKGILATGGWIRADAVTAVSDVMDLSKLRPDPSMPPSNQKGFSYQIFLVGGSVVMLMPSMDEDDMQHNRTRLMGDVEKIIGDS